MSDDLLKHFIAETKDNFERVHGSITKLADAVMTLREFRVQVLTSSKWLTIIISSLIGALTLSLSLAGTYYIKVKMPAVPLPEAKASERLPEAAASMKLGG